MVEYTPGDKSVASSLQQLGWLGAKRHCNFLKVDERHIVLAALNTPNVASVQPSIDSQRFL